VATTPDDDARRESLRRIADTIESARREQVDAIRQSIEAEVAAMEAEGFDPARGRGRGPRWAEGG
jgi:hypothetical protein